MRTQVWETKLIDFDQTESGIEAAQKYADLMGEAGWELVAVTSLPDSNVPDPEAAAYRDVRLGHRILYTFKRLKPLPLES